MNRRRVVSISAIMMLGLTALPYSAISQQWSIKDQLVGTWTLASWEHAFPNGSRVQSYGINPKGIVVFDAKGRFFLMFARPDLPKIASNAPATATSEEAKLCWAVRSRTSAHAASTMPIESSAFASKPARSRISSRAIKMAGSSLSRPTNFITK